MRRPRCRRTIPAIWARRTTSTSWPTSSRPTARRPVPRRSRRQSPFPSARSPRPDPRRPLLSPPPHRARDETFPPCPLALPAEQRCCLLLELLILRHPVGIDRRVQHVLQLGPRLRV